MLYVQLGENTELIALEDLNQEEALKFDGKIIVEIWQDELSENEQEFLEKLNHIDEINLDLNVLKDNTKIFEKIPTQYIGKIKGTMGEVTRPVSKNLYYEVYEYRIKNKKLAEQYGLEWKLEVDLTNEDIEALLSGEKQEIEMLKRINEKFHFYDEKNKYDDETIEQLCNKFPMFEFEFEKIIDINEYYEGKLNQKNSERINISSIRVRNIQELEKYENEIAKEDNIRIIYEPPKSEKIDIEHINKLNTLGVTYVKLSQEQSSEIGYKGIADEEFLLNYIIMYEKVLRVITSTKDLNVEEALKLKEEGIKWIMVHQPTNKDSQYDTYDIDTYIEIRKKMDELVEGISPELSDSEKFKIIYERIGKNISYDTMAGYPKNEEEKKYSKEQEKNCRNLRNGLLEGKCVCGGYAEILRNALAMVGIEAEYVRGDIVEKVVSMYFSESDLEKYRKKMKNDDLVFFEDKEGKKRYIGEAHAWVKYKIEGEWYNADVTFDVPNIRKGVPLKWCYIADEELSKERKNVTGIKCKNKLTENEISKLLGYKPHKYIAGVKIPNIEEIAMARRNCMEAISMFGRQVKEELIELKNKIMRMIEREKIKSLPSPKEQIILQPDKKTVNLKSWDMKNYDMSNIEQENSNDEIQAKKQNIKDDDEISL